MGKIVSLEPVKTVQVKGQDRKVVQFRMVDSRFAKICFYRGEVQIRNAFDASIVYLDPTMEEALLFKEKLLEDELPLAVIEKKNGKREVVLQEDDWKDLEIKMISELFVANQTIIGHDAVDLWDGSYDEVEDPELLPEPIKEIVGKSFCFGISVSDDNVTNGADTFRVLEFNVKTKPRSHSMKRKKTDYHSGDRANHNITPETLKDKRTFSNASQFCSNSITNQDIPLRSVYYRLFEAMEGRNVPPNTHSLNQQISMLSPQTPRNKRRCVLGLDILTNQTSDSPKQSSCMTNLTLITSIPFMPLASILQKTKENSFKKLPYKRQRKGTSNILKDITNIDFSLGSENQESPSPTVIPEPDFGAIVDETGELEFDCSSLDTTDSEYETEDVDGPSSTAATKGKNKDGIVFLK
ncbi:hypothetical protein F2Q69_00018817 [Brassica cretica]|uniref:Uncharacterized protein n=1 Tax=Brassica cretica TaxID=69181 RepID=A0A8S9QKS1_BRACR|nr:hypothetical protein F2Q69_00018817 [Brassica cretica]